MSRYAVLGPGNRLETDEALGAIVVERLVVERLVAEPALLAGCRPRAPWS